MHGYSYANHLFHLAAIAGCFGKSIRMEVFRKNADSIFYMCLFKGLNGKKNVFVMMLLLIFQRKWTFSELKNQYNAFLQLRLCKI